VGSWRGCWLGYDAFISYSHDADGQLASAIQRGLARFAKPWYRRRALAVFRDETGLSTNPDLWRSIEATLDDSRWFVLLASPTAAESQWVNREVEHWLQVHDASSLLPVVTDGEWVWDPRAGDFDDASTAAPHALRGVFRAEPRHLDMRWARSDLDLDVRNPRFHDAIADLAAPIHGRPKDDLAGEDIRQHRRTVRVAWAAGTALALLLVVALIAAGVALQQSTQANHARDRADSAATTADALRLAAESISGSHADLSRSMLLAVEAHRLFDDNQTRGALLSVAQAAAPVQRMIHGSWDAAALAPDGRSVFVVSRAGVFRFDLASRTRQQISAADFGPVRTAAISGDGRLLALAGRDVRLVDLRTGAEARPPLRTGVQSAVVNGVQFSPTGSALAVITYPVPVMIEWSLPSGREIGRVDSGGVLELGGLDYSRDGRWLTDAGQPGVVYDARTLQPRYQISPTNSGVERNVAMFPDGSRVAVARFDRVFVRDADTGAAGTFSMASATPVAILAVSPDGKAIAGASDDGTVSAWDSRTGLPLRAPLVGATRPPLFLHFGSPTRLVLATTSEIIVFDISSGFGRPTHIASDDVVFEVAVSSDDHFVAGANLGGNVEVRDVGRRTTVHLPNQGQAPSVAFRPGAAEVAIGSRDGTVTFRDARNGRALRAPIRLTAATPRGIALIGRGVVSLAYSGDGRILVATTGGGDLAIIDAARGTLIRRFPVQAPAFTMPLAVSPDGKLVATAGSRGVVETTVIGRQRRQLENGLAFVVSLAYSPDGKRLAVGLTDGRVLLLDPTTLRALAPPLVSNHGSPYGLAFDPTGHLLAVSGATITVWDVASGEAIGTDLVAPNRLLPIAFSHDGHTLYAGSEGGGIVAFGIWTPSLVELLCDTAGRNLSVDEWQRLISRRPYRTTCPQWPSSH
jgi:WD40 repeat protein